VVRLETRRLGRGRGRGNSLELASLLNSGEASELILDEDLSGVGDSLESFGEDTSVDADEATKGGAAVREGGTALAAEFAGDVVTRTTLGDIVLNRALEGDILDLWGDVHRVG